MTDNGLVSMMAKPQPNREMRMPPTPSTDLNLDQTQLMAHAVTPRAAPAAAVALVKGGTSINYSGETNQLLTERLRLTSLLLAGGFGAFLLKGMIYPAREASKANWFLLPLLGAVTVITAIVAQRICSGCQKTRSHLRLVELLIFGAPAILFLALGYSTLLHGAKMGYIPPITVPWLILIFTYALFIPNTWQRALFMILPPAIAPVATLVAAWILVPEVRNVISAGGDFHYVILESVMVMAFGATIAVWGVKTIGTLRSKAYEARKLGQYRLKRLLGKGGMGEVYLAEHVMLKRPCAIKLIRPDIAGDPETLGRFEREVQSTAKLTHWNTVEIFDFGRADDGTFYYVMEYLPGMSLDHLVQEHGPLPPGRVIHLLSQTCDALAEAHAHDMIHRDIKPGNIFSARRGGVYDVAKLLDFGLVRYTGMEGGDVRLTQSGTVTGSPLYMPPEQASGDSVDARSDIYALGCVAYYLLTGLPPFQEDRAIKLILAHAQQFPSPPSQLNPQVPDDLERVVLKCLQKKPEDRYQSVVALKHALQKCIAATEWDSDVAAGWWRMYGCPKKQEFDACVIEGRDLVDSHQEVERDALHVELQGV